MGLLLALTIAAVAEYVLHNNGLAAVALNFAKAIGLLAAVMYVVYTRDMALATAGVLAANKGIVLANLYQSTSSYEKLPESARQVCREVHLADKRLEMDEFGNLCKVKDTPAVKLKVWNLTPRHILLLKGYFTVRNRDEDPVRDLVLDFGKLPLSPDARQHLTAMVMPKGHVVVSLKRVEYWDAASEELCVAELGLAYVAVREVAEPRKASPEVPPNA